MLTVTLCHDSGGRNDNIRVTVMLQAAPESLGTYGQEEALGTYGRSLDSTAVATSAPGKSAGRGRGEERISVTVPDNAFTVDSQAPSSFDSYNTNSLSEPVEQQDSGVIVDLTQKYQSTEQNLEPELQINNVVDIRTPNQDSEVLPPIVDLTDTEYNKLNDITLELINEEAVESATPTSAPVLFTYAPAEGPTQASSNRFSRFAKGLNKLKHKKLYYKLLITDFLNESGKLFAK